MLTGATSSARKISSQPLAAAAPAPVRTRPTASAATAGRRSRVRDRPVRDSADPTPGRLRGCGRGQALPGGVHIHVRCALLGRQGRADVRGVLSHGGQRGEALRAAGDVLAVGVGHPGRLVEQPAQHAFSRMTHDGSTPCEGRTRRVERSCRRFRGTCRGPRRHRRSSSRCAGVRGPRLACGGAGRAPRVRGCVPRASPRRRRRRTRRCAPLTAAISSRELRRRPERSTFSAVWAAATESQPPASPAGTDERPRDRNTSCATSSAWSREPSTRAATPTTRGYSRRKISSRSARTAPRVEPDTVTRFVLSSLTPTAPATAPGAARTAAGAARPYRLRST